MEKDATALVPDGIVTEAGPFHAAIAKLLTPFEDQLRQRDDAVAKVGAAASPESAAALASALKVMEQEYGRKTMVKFLKYEMDNYLRGRGGERIEEMPLYLVENQPYIHYRKGSVVMYALRDAVGEQPLNHALSNYVAAMKFQEPPYTYTLELLEYLRRAVPDDRLLFRKVAQKGRKLRGGRLTVGVHDERGIQGGTVGDIERYRPPLFLNLCPQLP